MVDSHNLEASSAIRVTAVILIIVSLMSIYWLIKSLTNLKYKSAQLFLIGIYLMPIIIGWLAWIQMMKTSQLKSMWLIESLLKAICLASFLEYIQRMIGWTVINGENLFDKQVLYENMVTNRSPKCIGDCCNVRPINSTDTARWYIGRISRCVYQLCFVFTISALVGIVYALADDDIELDSNKGSKLFLLISGINSVSSVIALVALINFGMYTQKLPVTTNLKILQKFVIIKLGILFTEAQPLIVAIFAYTECIASTDRFSVEEIMMYTNSLLVVSEMIIMSFLIQDYFPLSDYEMTADERKKLVDNEDYTIDLKDN